MISTFRNYAWLVMYPISGFAVRLGVTLLFTVLLYSVDLIFKFIHPAVTYSTLVGYFALAYHRWVMWAAWN